jgi:xanthine dehydrogenase iron-sulfur cluster and FAD-binding subunit A
MWHTYYAPGAITEALDLLARHGDACRLIAGGTDLILEIERGVRKQEIIVDVSRIAGLDEIAFYSPGEERLGTGRLGASPPIPSPYSLAPHVILGANVTHNQVVASADAVAHAFPLARACWLVGAPQIRNRGTVAGNCVTGSPAMDATFTLASRDRGERTLTCAEFFRGVRKTALAPDEMLIRINVPALKPTERGTFLKLGLRQAQAISVVNVAVILDIGYWVLENSPIPNTQYPVTRARIALGSVAPTIVRAGEAEAYLAGMELTDEVIERAAELAATAARPISDIRGSADYRRDMVRVLTARALRQLRDGTERADWPEKPVLLQGSGVRDQGSGIKGQESHREASRSGVGFTLNGKPTTLQNVRGKTLLRALREDAGLTGTKEGCAEGECGACTVWLDGVAVMSCLVPAERAEGCEVVTVEGLANLPPPAPLPYERRGEIGSPLLVGEGLGERLVRLHPLQQAFIDTAAVQCGYCTPGILMSAANLLEEFPQPTADQVKQALTGNLCRCTGYYKILEAIERATVR